MTISNGIDPVVAKRWVGEALRVYQALEDQKIANMNACRTIRARFPEIFENAKNAGLPIKALKLTIKQRLLELKIEGLQEDIDGLVPEDEEDAETFEQFREAIGDFGELPLGKAAVEKKAAEEEDLRPRHLREQEEERKANDDAAAENAKKIKSGIKGLGDGADAAHA